MGCGASKVNPSIQEKPCLSKDKPTKTTSIENLKNNGHKTRSSENVRPSSKTKLLTERPNSASGSLKSAETPKKDKNKSLIRDSNGSIKAQSFSSVNDDLDKQLSEDLAKRNSRAELFAAKPPTPVQSASENGLSKPKPTAFVVSLDNKAVAGRPPRRLESLVNAPKPLTEEELKEKIRLKTERRELELQRRKLKSSRMSRRKRDLVEAMEQSKQQDQADELKSKMQSTGDNRERIKAERIEKQRKHREHVEKVRERAKRIKAGEELDEGLGGELETYKNSSDEETTNIWRSTDDEIDTTPSSMKNKNSRVSLDTVDSGVAKLKEDSIDDFYNA